MTIGSIELDPLRIREVSIKLAANAPTATALRQNSISSLRQD